MGKKPSSFSISFPASTLALISGKYETCWSFYKSRFLRIFRTLLDSNLAILLVCSLTGMFFGKWLAWAPSSIGLQIEMESPDFCLQRPAM